MAKQVILHPPAPVVPRHTRSTTPTHPPFKKPPSPCALTTRDTDGLVASMRKTADLHHKLAEEAKRKRRLEVAWLHYGIRDGTRSAMRDVTSAIRTAQGRSMSPKERRDRFGDVESPVTEVAQRILTLIESRFDDCPEEFWVGVNAFLKILVRSQNLRAAAARMRQIANAYLEARGDSHDVRTRWIIKGMSAVVQSLGRQFPGGHVPLESS